MTVPLCRPTCRCTSWPAIPPTPTGRVGKVRRHAGANRGPLVVRATGVHPGRMTPGTPAGQGCRAQSTTVMAERGQLRAASSTFWRSSSWLLVEDVEQVVVAHLEDLGGGGHAQGVGLAAVVVDDHPHAPSVRRRPGARRPPRPALPRWIGTTCCRSVPQLPEPGSGGRSGSPSGGSRGSASSPTSGARRRLAGAPPARWRPDPPRLGREGGGWRRGLAHRRP